MTTTQASFVQLTDQLSLMPNLVGFITYDSHARSVQAWDGECDIDCCDLACSQDAYWTGEIDTWGKLTIKPVDGTAPHYLFPDEIVDVEYEP